MKLDEVETVVLIIAYIFYVAVGIGTYVKYYTKEKDLTLKWLIVGVCMSMVWGIFMPLMNDMVEIKIDWNKVIFKNKKQ